MPLGIKEIENRFGFHKATIEGPNATNKMHTDLRHAFKIFANILDEVLPEGETETEIEYRKLAFNSLEMSSMWAHKGIAQTAPLIKE